MSKQDHIKSYNTSKGKRYSVSFRLMGQRFRKSNLLTKEEAERLYINVRSQIINGTWNEQKEALSSFSNINIEAAFNLYYKRIKSTNIYKSSSLYTKRDLLNRLRKILGKNTKVKTLTDYKVKKKIDTYHIQKELTPEYINHLIGVWNQFVKWSLDYNIQEHLSPLKWIKTNTQKGEDSFLTREELRSFFNVFSQKPHERVYYRTFKVCFNLALRIGELAALRWEDIDWERRQIIIARTMVKSIGKGRATNRVKAGNPTILPLTAETYALLLEQKEYTENTKVKGEYRYRNSGLVFPSRSTAKMLDWSIANMVLKRFFKRTGINKKISSHTLRRSFCLIALEQGINIKVLSQYTRHNAETLLKHYSAVRGEYFMRTFESFQPLLPTGKANIRSISQPEQPLEAENLINIGELEGENFGQ